MPDKTFDGLWGMAYMVVIAKRALVGADALFERPGGIMRGFHGLLVRGIHPFASARLSPQPALTTHIRRRAVWCPAVPTALGVIGEQ